MPLKIRTSNADQYSGALLGYSQPLDEAIAELPGLLGAWDAADYTSGTTWAPRIGSNPGVVLAAAGTAPVAATRDGRPVIRFVTGSKAFVNNNAGTALSLTGLTFASRAYYSDVVTNFQKVLDFGTPEFFFRSSLASPIWQFTGVGTAGTTPIATPLADWHTVLFRKTGTDAARLAADGAAEVDISGAGTAMSGLTLVIGDAANVTSAVQDISRMIICDTGALSPAQRLAVQTWIGG